MANKPIKQLTRSTDNVGGGEEEFYPINNLEGIIVNTYGDYKKNKFPYLINLERVIPFIDVFMLTHHIEHTVPIGLTIGGSMNFYNNNLSFYVDENEEKDLIDTIPDSAMGNTHVLLRRLYQVLKRDLDNRGRDALFSNGYYTAPIDLLIMNYFNYVYTIKDNKRVFVKPQFITFEVEYDANDDNNYYTVNGYIENSNYECIIYLDNLNYGLDIGITGLKRSNPNMHLILKAIKDITPT